MHSYSRDSDKILETEERPRVAEELDPEDATQNRKSLVGSLILEGRAISAREGQLREGAMEDSREQDALGISARRTTR